MAIEWYLVQLDRDTIFYGTNAHLGVDYEAGQLRVRTYRFKLDSYDIFATRPGIVTFGDKGIVSLETLWVNDAIRLNGIYDLHKKSADLSIT